MYAFKSARQRARRRHARARRPPDRGRRAGGAARRHRQPDGRARPATRESSALRDPRHDPGRGAGARRRLLVPARRHLRPRLRAGDSAYPFRGIRTGARRRRPATRRATSGSRRCGRCWTPSPTRRSTSRSRCRRTTGEPGGRGCDDARARCSYCDDPTASIPVAHALADVLDEPAVQVAARDIIAVSFDDNLVAGVPQQRRPARAGRRWRPGLAEAALVRTATGPAARSRTSPPSRCRPKFGSCRCRSC